MDQLADVAVSSFRRNRVCKNPKKHLTSVRHAGLDPASSNVMWVKTLDSGSVILDSIQDRNDNRAEYAVLIFATLYRKPEPRNIR